MAPPQNAPLERDFQVLTGGRVSAGNSFKVTGRFVPEIADLSLEIRDARAESSDVSACTLLSSNDHFTESALHAGDILGEDSDFELGGC